MKISGTSLMLAFLISFGFLLPSCGGSDGDADGDADGDTEMEAQAEQEETAPDPLACDDEAGCFTLSYNLWGEVDGHIPSRYNVLPFPYDYFTTTAATPTGRKLNLCTPKDKWSTEINTVLVDRGLNIFQAERYIKDINSLDGFSVNGNILVVTGEKLDTDLLPTEGMQSLEDAVVLLNIDPNSDDFGAPVSFLPLVEEACEYDDNDEATVHRYWYLALRPTMPLASGGRYAVLLRKNLKDVSGRSPVPSAHFAQVWGLKDVDLDSDGGQARAAERQRLEALKTTLSGIQGLALENLVLAFDFTTSTATRDNLCVMEKRFPAMPMATPDMDFDHDGEENFYALADYPSHLPSLPSVHRYVSDTVGYVAVGHLDIPEWRHYKNKDEADTKGYYEFVRDEEGCPVQNGVNAIEFFLIYPKNPVEPMPVIMLQHGIDSRKEAMGFLAGILAKHGIASFLMDFPFHGTRAMGLSSLEFIDLNYMLKTASNFKQASLEQAYVLRALNAGAFDLYPGPTGNGVSDFDPDRIGYAGHSLGSIVGEVSTALSPEVDIAYYNVGGMRLMDFVDGFMAGVFPPYVTRQFGTLAQIALDSGDPATFGPSIRDKHSENRLQYLFVQAMEDETIPWQFSLNFGLTVRPAQVKPIAFPFGNLLQVDAPYTEGAGHYQYRGANHNFLFSGDDIGTRARAQFEEFFKSFVEIGTATIIDPYEQ